MAGCSSKKCGRKIQMTEDIMIDQRLPKQIGGDKWRKLARQLKFTQAAIDTIKSDYSSSSNECCIAVIVRWINKWGENATVEKFADALIKIGLGNVAETLQEYLSSPEKEEPGANAPNQLQDRIQELEKENQSITQGSLELEQKLAIVKQQLQDTSQPQEIEYQKNEMEKNWDLLERKLQDRIQQLEKENESITQGNLELEEELAIVKQQLQDTSNAQEALEDNSDVSRQENDSGDTRNDAEREVDEMLKDLNEQLYRKVKSRLQVPEVKEDKLRVSVTLDLLTKLSVILQELYSSVLSMTTKTCKCSEKVKREFYEFAYHGIRAEHNDLVHRVEDLATVQEKMTDEEEKDFGKLQQLQTNRRRQVVRLENLWRGLFSPPESLPPSSHCAPCPTCLSKKDSRRKCTDPVAKLKPKVRPGEQNTSPVAETMREDKKFGTRFPNMTKTLRGKKRSEENPVRLMSYSEINLRDS